MELTKTKRGVMAIVMTLLFMLATYFTTNVVSVVFGGVQGVAAIITVVLWILFGAVFFVANASGRSDKIRTIFFFSYALVFTFSFITELYELRHHFYFVTFENFTCGDVPFCHIGIPQTLPSLLLKGEASFPGSIIDESSHYGIGGMFVLWMGASLLLGRGWCSWTCFFGGWEDGMTLVKKKAWKKRFPKVWQYTPFAVLITVALISLLTVSPVYCMWLCPFKGVSEAIEIVSPLGVIQTIIFTLLFIGLVILLPLMSKKRTQCAFLCPFGAMQSLVDKVTPFSVRIIKEKCIKCGKCINVCPMMSIEKDNLETGKVRLNCIKCGRCMDACPEKAITYHIKGTPLGASWAYHVGNYTFRYLGFFLLATMSSNMFFETFFRLYKLITTGSILIGS